MTLLVTTAVLLFIVSISGIVLGIKFLRLKKEFLKLTSRRPDEKFYKAFQSNPDIIIITTVKDSRIVEFNDGFLKWSGYTAEEVSGKTTLEMGFWIEEERTQMKNLLLRNGKFADHEVRLQIKSGEWRACIMSAEIIEINGEDCLVSVTRDITQKKNQEELLLNLLNIEKSLNEELAIREEELAASEEELRQSFEMQSHLLNEIRIKEANVSALMNNTKDLIYSVDKNLHLVEFNTSIQKFFAKRGVSLRKGMHVTEFIHLPNQDKVLNTLTMALNGQPSVIDFDIPQEEELLHFEGSYNQILNDQHQSLGVSVMIRNISGRKKAEDALRASQEKYAKSFRAIPDSIIISTISEGKILEANDAFIHVTGMNRERVIGKTTIELGLFSSEEDRQQIIGEVNEKGRIVNKEIYVQIGAERRTIALSAETITMDGEDCIISVGRDITERKKAEDAIRITNDRLKLILDNIPLAVWAIDRNGIITLSEGKALEDMGLKPGEHVGLSVYDVYQHRLEHLYYIKPVIEEGAVHRRSELINGRYYEEIIAPIFDSTSRITGLIGVSFDVTTLRVAESKVIENEQLLNNIIDHLPIGLQIFDAQGFSVKMNEAQRKLLGLKSAKDGIGIFNAKNDRSNTLLGLNDLFKRAFQGERIENEEIEVDFFKLNDARYPRLDSAWYNLWLFPVFNSAGEVEAIINLMSDITGRKKSEKEIEQINKMMADYKLMALRSAMNPHFIFNAMNSIQYFISKNERENALIYLSLFSKLIRNILTGTVENKITIHHEMETLQNYIELENLRFDMKFEVRYEIDELLDIRHIEIPSLLLQPYVENAIQHGLYNKKEKGLLIIKIASHDENTIIFTVEDNGVGREEARRIKAESQFSKHKSVGMVLNQERLDIVNKTNHVSVKITDLKTSEGKAAGTRIELLVEVVM